LPAPVSFKLGVDPVHFGLGIVLNLTIGAVTPPVGTILSSVCASVELSIGLAPFLLALTIAVSSAPASRRPSMGA
jgi:TRAP-type C4-dicarboxylate transport system permease large subunit